MASRAGIDLLSVEQLLEAVNRLTPPQRREFQRRLAARHGEQGAARPRDEELIRAAQARLPVVAERRLRMLGARSERGRLTAKELVDYQALAQEAQRMDAARAEALAELARRMGESVGAVRAMIDGEGRADDA